MRKLKRKKTRFLIPLKVKIAAVVAGVLAAGFCAFLMQPSGKVFVKKIGDHIESIQNKAHFVLEQVEVEGHVRTSSETINEVLNLTQNMPIFDVDLDVVQQALLELPWVRSAVVERHLPAKLYIRIEEKNPIALWQNNKTYWPLDELGHPIHDTKSVLMNTVLVVGKDAPEHTRALIEALEKHPHIFSKVRSAVRIGNRRWNLILNDVEKGLVVYLPEEDIGSALERLENLEESDKILQKDLKIIDLRLADRLIIRTNAEELMKQKRAKK